MDRRAFLGGSAALGLTAVLPGRARLAESLQRVRPVRDVEGAARLADEYLLEPGLLYLNHGSIGTIPRAVHEAHVSYLATCETNPWLYMWGGAWDEAVAETRSRAASLVGCASDDVAITHNTTEGFNVLAQGLPLGPGDEVLFSSLNHISASQAWRYYGARKGYDVRTFEIPLADVPGLSVADVVALHERAVGPRTRVLVLPEVDNVVGIRHPVREITAMARRRGVEFVAVDSAQSLAMMPVDMAGSGADFYAASPHKWVQAPKGLGLLAARPAARERLDPLWVKYDRGRLPDTAAVFEDYSTRNLPQVVTLADALAFQARLDGDTRAGRYLEIRRWFRDAVEATPSLEWRSPTDTGLASSLYAIEVRGGRAGGIATRLFEDHRIVVRGFPMPINTLRVSPNLITTEGDVDRFIAATEASSRDG